MPNTREKLIELLCDVIETERRMIMRGFEATEQAYKNGLRDGRNEIKAIPATVDPGANIPTRAHKNDAGLDLYATKGGWILPKCRKIFGTGFHVAIPIGYVGMLTSKSGLMLKGITSRGTVDADYTGEVKAILYNHSWLPKRIKKGQKITQMVIMPIITPRLDVVESLEATARGDNGFGSTGL